MRKIVAFLLLLILLSASVLVVSCTNKDDQLIIGNIKSSYNYPEPTIAVVADVSVPDYDPEIKELLNRGKKIKTYHYLFNERWRNQYGRYENEPAYDVYIKENYVRKSYVFSQQLKGDFYYTDVYMDTDKKSAFVSCTKGGIVCEPGRNKMFAVNYDTEELEFTPVDLLWEVKIDAKKVGEELIDNRQTLILEFSLGNEKYEQLAIDTYSGLPLRKEILVVEEGERVLLKRYSFSRIMIGGILDSEVKIPKNLELGELN